VTAVAYDLDGYRDPSDLPPPSHSTVWPPTGPARTVVQRATPHSPTVQATAEGTERTPNWVRPQPAEAGGRVASTGAAGHQTYLLAPGRLGRLVHRVDKTVAPLDAGQTPIGECGAHCHPPVAVEQILAGYGWCDRCWDVSGP